MCATTPPSTSCRGDPQPRFARGCRSHRLRGMTRVAVLGAKGRMGSTSVAAIDAADGLEVVSQVDVGDSLDAITDAGAEVALDFTQPDAALDNVRWCIEHGVNVVVGTSGF